MAREDWSIIRALSEVSGYKLPYDNLQDLRSRMKEVAPHLVKYGDLEAANFFALAAKLLKSSKMAAKSLTPPQTSLEDFYMTDVISRSSPTMAKCVAAVKEDLEKNRY